MGFYWRARFKVWKTILGPSRWVIAATIESGLLLVAAALASAHHPIRALVVAFLPLVFLLKAAE